MKRHWRALAPVCCLALALFASGCENSENPASDPEQSEPVPELHGVWRTQWSDEEVQFFHVGVAGGNLPESMLRVELVTHKRSGELATHDQLMLVIPGGTDDRPILSAAAVDRDTLATMQKDGWDPDLAGDYFLYVYRLGGKELFLRGIERREQRRLIEEGIAEGRIMEPEGRFTWTRIRLTDPTEKLSEFLVSPEAGSLFSDEEHPLIRVDGISWPEKNEL